MLSVILHHILSHTKKNIKDKSLMHWKEYTTVSLQCDDEDSSESESEP